MRSELYAPRNLQQPDVDVMQPNVRSLDSRRREEFFFQVMSVLILLEYIGACFRGLVEHCTNQCITCHVARENELEVPTFGQALESANCD